MTTLKALHERALGGTPIYAECGGLVYLAEALEDLTGVAHPMVGRLPRVWRLEGGHGADRAEGYLIHRTCADAR